MTPRTEVDYDIQWLTMYGPNKEFWRRKGPIHVE